MSDPNWPGRYHEASEDGGIVRVWATEAFSTRDRESLGCGLALFASIGGPLLIGVTQAKDGCSSAMMLGCIAFTFLLFVVPALRSPPPRDPLHLTKAGRIEYRGNVLLEGPVTAVRLIRVARGSDDPDTYHIVCEGAGTKAELPSPDFGAATDLRELAVLAVWLADFFGVPAPKNAEEDSRGQQ